MSRQVLLGLRALILVSMAGFLAAGCAILQPQDPPAFNALDKVRAALAAAKKASVSEKCLNEYGELYQGYLTARGILYACDDAKALAMADELLLKIKNLVDHGCGAPNQDPQVQCHIPSPGKVGEELAFRVDASDPDGDALTCDWSFGDGATLSGFDVTHTYTAIGFYTVEATCSDGKDGKAQCAKDVEIIARMIVPSEVLFDFDKDRLKAEGIRTLERDVLPQLINTDYSVELIGHTDSIGTEAYNQDLSERRADAVRTFLINNGIASHRITAQGRGESEPVAPNDTKEGQAKNRRTEIIIRP